MSSQTGHSRYRGAVTATVLLVSLSVLEGFASDSNPDAEYMGRLVYEAQQQARFYPDFYRINPSLSDVELYAVQKEFVRRKLDGGDAIMGFKGGLIPAAPVGGVMFKGGVLKIGEAVKHSDFRLLVIEAEIAFRFCADVHEPLSDVAALKQVVCELVPTMEVADGALADFGKIKADLKHLRNALLPVNVAFAHVLLGQPLPAQSIDPAQIAVSMALNGRVIGERKLDPPIDLWANVLWIVNHFILEQGYTIARGQVIIPGNLTGIHVGEAGRYEADFGALGSVELEVQ